MPRRASTFAAQLGARIAALRGEQDITQEKLAWEAELSSKGYMSRIESGERLPSLEVLQRIAERLGVEVRDLFIFPDSGPVPAAMERLRREGEDLVRQVLNAPAMSLAQRRPPSERGQKVTRR